MLRVAAMSSCDFIGPPRGGEVDSGSLRAGTRSLLLRSWEPDRCAVETGRTLRVFPDAVKLVVARSVNAVIIPPHARNPRRLGGLCIRAPALWRPGRR